MIVLALSMAGCGADAALGAADTAEVAPPGCLEVPATVALGGSGSDDLGRPTWTEMPAGSPQTMVHGPQGGWHILAGADVRHAGDIVTLIYTIHWPAHDDAQVSYGNFKVMLVPHDDGCGGWYAGMYGILDVTALADGEADTPPELLGGETLLLRMQATDLEGRTATDEVEVIAALDPVDVDDGDTAAE